MQINLDNLSKSFASGRGRVQVLEGVTAQIDSGQFVALVGRSGSGKTTLLNLVGALDSPDAGRIVVGDLEVTAGDDRQRARYRRRHCGFVFQFFNLIPTLSARENVRLPLELLGTPANEAAARARDMLDAMDMLPLAERFPEELSGGEQQRIAIARALVHRPGVVLADEPTGNLDAATADRVMDLLLGQCREYGVTLLMATHSSEITGRAGTVLEVSDGRLRER